MLLWMLAIFLALCAIYRPILGMFNKVIYRLRAKELATSRYKFVITYIRKKETRSALNWVSNSNKHPTLVTLLNNAADIYSDKNSETYLESILNKTKQEIEWYTIRKD